MYDKIDEIMKSDQGSKDDENKVNEVVNNVKRWTGGHGFTSRVSQVNKICMRWVNKLQLGN